MRLEDGDARTFLLTRLYVSGYVWLSTSMRTPRIINLTQYALLITSTPHTPRNIAYTAPALMTPCS